MPMALLLNWRIWLALIVAGTLAFTHLTVYRKGKADDRAEWMASVAKANEDARKLEQRRQDLVADAQRDAAMRDVRLRADVDRARSESDGLRNDLSAANEYAKESRAAAERVAALATDLFGRCTARYLSVAEGAARADSEARELRQGWPQ